MLLWAAWVRIRNGWKKGSFHETLRDTRRGDDSGYCVYI